jgi:hypothetical protein
MKGVRRQRSQVRANGLKHAVASARSLGTTRAHARKIL